MPPTRTAHDAYIDVVVQANKYARKISKRVADLPPASDTTNWADVGDVARINLQLSEALDRLAILWPDPSPQTTETK